MNIQNQIKYLLIYVILNIAGIFVSSKFWWTDSLTLFFLKRESFLLIVSVGICWIGILYLSILIIRKFIVNINTQNFIGPLDLISNEEEIGTEKAIKIKNRLPLVAFPLLAITIIGFVISMNIYQKNQIKEHGVNEIVTVREIRKDIKKHTYVNFKYNGGKDETNLRNEKELKIGDKFQVRFSSENPKIITYQN